MSQEPPSGFPPPPPGPPGLPPPLPSGSPPGGGTPWERRQEIGFVTALIETTKEVLTSPTDFFRRMPVSGGIGAPLLYAVIVGYLGILVSAVYGAVFLLVRGAVGGAGFGPFAHRPELARFAEAYADWGGLVGQVVFGPIGIVIGLFVSAGIVHVMLLLLDGAGQGFEATFRVLAYSQASSVLSIVPFCGGLIAGLYALVLSIIGLAEAQRISAWKAAAAVLVPLFLCCCCCAIGITIMVGGLASILGQAR